MSALASPPPLLRVENLSVSYPVRAGLFGTRPLRAVHKVGFALNDNDALGIVGESGCGKSSLARAVMRLVPPSGGRVWFGGIDWTALGGGELRRRRRDMQMIFQDPVASLDPRMRAEDIVAEPLRSFAPEESSRQIRARARAMLERVGLSAAMGGRYPHEFSGGQAQRLGIARALICRPKLLVCDEPVSALDVSVRAQIINLLAGVRREYGLAMLFISHDLAVVRRLCTRVMVLYLGRTMEEAACKTLFQSPRHPYTKALLQAANPEAAAPLSGEAPSALNPPSGCVFRTRCRYARPECAQTLPPPAAAGDNHTTACLRWREIFD